MQKSNNSSFVHYLTILILLNFLVPLPIYSQESKDSLQPNSITQTSTESKNKTEKNSQEKSGSDIKNIKVEKDEEEDEDADDKKKDGEKTFNPNWFTSNLGEGFTITSDDGESLINLRIRAQVRGTQNIVPEDRSQDSTNFATRRMRLMARGKLKGDEWHYYVQLGFANQDMEQDREIPLRDSIITYNGWDSIKFSFGQMKVPFNRQRLNSSSALQLVDRSIVNAELNLDRDVGIQMFTHDFFGLSKNISMNVGVFGGDGRNRSSTGTGVLSVAKISYFPFGNFLGDKLAGVDDELLSEGDFKRHKTPKISFGLGGGYNSNTRRSQSTIGQVYEFARFNYTHGLAEFLLKWQGWTFTTEYIYRSANLPYMERELPTGVLEREYSRSGRGYFFQLAYLFENNWEIATRWGEMIPIENTDPRFVYSREAGGGVSYYFSKHNLKWQLDYFKLTGNPDRLADNHEIRTQLQLFY